MVATKYFVREAIKNLAKLGILSQPRRTPFPISILRFKKKHKQMGLGTTPPPRPPPRTQISTFVNVCQNMKFGHILYSSPNEIWLSLTQPTTQLTAFWV